MNKQPLSVCADGCDLLVFRVGTSPSLHNSVGPVPPTEALKLIHSHFAYEVFFAVDGITRLVTEGRTEEYRERIIIVPPGKKHVSILTRAECYCLLFSFRDSGEHTAAIRAYLDGGIRTLPLTRTVSFYIRQFTRMFLFNSPEGEEASGHLASLIFGELLPTLRQLPAEMAAKPHKSSRHISAVEEYIHLNLHRKLTLTETASRLHLSARQVSRIVAQEFGCSFSELVTDKRLDLCRMLLKETDLPVSRVAEQIFPGTPNYFYAVFKRRCGMTPAKYRAAFRREAPTDSPG